MYQLLVLLFWDVMDDCAALGETIPDDIRKDLPGRSKANEFGLGYDFDKEFDKRFVARAKEVLQLTDKQMSALIPVKREDFILCRSEIDGIAKRKAIFLFRLRRRIQLVIGRLQRQSNFRGKLCKQRLGALLVVGMVGDNAGQGFAHKGQDIVAVR